MSRLPILVLAAGLLAGCAGFPQVNPDVTSVPPASSEARQAQAFSTYLSARFAAGEHDLHQAASYYGRSLANDPSNPSLLALSFFYASTSGDMDKAGEYARKVIATDADDRAARLALAVIALKDKDYKDTRANLAQSAKGPFTQLTLSLFDAWAAAAQRDKAAVEADLATLRAQKGAENLAAFHAALLHEFMGENKIADADFQKAMAGQSVTPRVLEAYGRFLERNGRRDEAAALYQAHLGNQGLSAVTVTGLQRVVKHEKPDAMIRSAQDGVAEALFGIAASLTGEQSADVSILYLRMALYLRPDLNLAQILLADRFETLGKFDQAIAIYQAIPPSSPYHRMAAVQAALDLQRSGDNEAAIESLQKVVADDPQDVESWTALGDTYRSSENYPKAIEAYDRAVSLIKKPERRDWTLFYARAMAKERTGRLDESEADIETGLRLSPNQPELLNYLGYSWVDRGRRIPEALTMLEKARTLRPYDGYIVDSVGWAYYKLGRYQDAARTLEAAVLLVPGDPTINDHFGDALWRAGRKIEARFQWNHAITFSEDEADKAVIARKLKSGLAKLPV
ncbi:MAG: tetratricopeptide repeat protein [Alphaproteobacteria bacterium]|nr:tetratricopeptide repeat protein [Alphaproteobacteria bacterium]